MRPKGRARSVSTPLDLIRFPVPAEAAGVEAHCPRCSRPLSLHQPDLDTPDRFLGVCERCKGWFLIDLGADLSQGVMVRLPDTLVVRSLSQEGPSGGISTMGPGVGR